MRELFSGVSTKLRRFWTILVLFLVLRLIAGVVLVAIDDSFAWGIELTLIVAATFIICIAVALAVRRWAPPRRVS